MKQLTLFHLPKEVIFGGELLVGKRKTKRPLSTRHAIKTVIRGDVTQCGTFRAYPRRITKMVNHYAKKFNIRIYEFSINSNHLHLLIKISQLKTSVVLCEHFVGLWLSNSTSNGTIARGLALLVGDAPSKLRETMWSRIKRSLRGRLHINQESRYQKEKHRRRLESQWSIHFLNY
jgi:hypothetical protein